MIAGNDDERHGTTPVTGAGQRLRVILLGRVAVAAEADAAAATDDARAVRGSRNQQLLALLAHSAGRPIGHDRLIDALWRDDDLPNDPGATLRTYIRRLRTAIAPLEVERVPGGYRLALDPRETDVGAFERHVDAALDRWKAGDHVAAGNAADRATALWAGPPLGLPDHWSGTSAITSRLDELHAVAEEYGAAAMLASGEVDKVVPVLRALCEEQPLREWRWELLMTALYHSGKQADALRAFSAARTHLVETAGIEPSPGLAALETAILEQRPLGLPLTAGPAPARRTADSTAVRDTGLVGRTSITAQLAAGIQRLADGTEPTPLQLLRGEAGIGKTRILQHLDRLAHAGEASPHWGLCFEGEAQEPYRPIRQILRSILSEHGGQAARWATEGKGDLTALLPHLARGDAPASSPGEDQQLRLFDSVAGFLRRVALHRPIVIMVDDLQWADPSTISLLAHVMRHTRDAPLLFALAYREGELHPDAIEWLTHAGREYPTTVHQLGGLAPDELVQLLADAGGYPPAPDSVVRIHELTAGNPLFATEMWVAANSGDDGASIDDALDAMPSEVRDVLRTTTNALSSNCAELLRAIALVPGLVPLELIQALPLLPSAELLDALDEALDARVLVETIQDSSPTYDFRHVLFRRVIEQDLSRARRVAIHLQLVTACEQLHEQSPDRWLAATAHHWYEAGRAANPRMAMRRNLEAAERDRDRTGYTESITHCDRAIDAAGWVETSDTTDLAAVHLCRAWCHHRTGDPESRRTDARASFDFASEANEVALAAQAALIHGGERSTYGVANEETTAILRAALAMFDAADPATGTPELRALRARLLSRLAQEDHHAGAYDGARAMSARAVADASGLDDRTMANVYHGRIWTLNHPDWLDERCAIADQMVGHARSCEDDELLMGALVWRCASMVERGEVEVLDRDLAELEAINTRVRAPSHEVRLATLRTTRAAMRADFATAMMLAEEAHQLGQVVEPENADQVLQAQMIGPLREMGMLGDVAPMIEAFAAEYADAPGWQCALAYVLSEVDQIDAARAVLDPLAAGGCTAVPRDLAWTQGIAYTALASHRCGHVAAADASYELLAPYRGRLVGLWDINCGGAVDSYLGWASLTLGDNDRAAGHFRDGIALNERSAVVGEALWSRAGEALAQPREGALEQIGAEAAELGMAGLVEFAAASR